MECFDSRDSGVFNWSLGPDYQKTKKAKGWTMIWMENETHVTQIIRNCIISWLLPLRPSLIEIIVISSLFYSPVHSLSLESLYHNFMTMARVCQLHLWTEIRFWIFKLNLLFLSIRLFLQLIGHSMGTNFKLPEGAFKQHWLRIPRMDLLGRIVES